MISWVVCGDSLVVWDVLVVEVRSWLREQYGVGGGATQLCWMVKEGWWMVWF